MCSPTSVAVVQDTHHSALSTGSTFAHEIGHLFNMCHDNSECLYYNSQTRLYIVSFVSVILEPWYRFPEAMKCSSGNGHLAASSTS